METRDWINIAAIIISPVVAVGVTLWYQKRTAKKDTKKDIFFTLMENRGSGVVFDETVQALNSIVVAFQDDEKVIKLWSDYYDSLCLAQIDPVRSGRLNIEMLTAMAQNLGYKKLTQIQIDKIYYPKAHADQMEQDNRINEELLRVLKSTESIVTKPRKA